MGVMFRGCVCGCGSTSKRGRKEVNPKVHFSNERTFLQWFKSAIFIGSGGLSVNAVSSGESVAGTLMVVSAVLILLWGVVVYYIRNFKLVTGHLSGLHDFWGPGLLSVILLLMFLYELNVDTPVSGLI